MKVKEILSDAFTVAGSIVGVGFLSGKEAQIYFGNNTNVWIFGGCFCLLVLTIRQFCHSHNTSTTEAFSQKCFGRAGGLFSVLLLTCCFVCAVTALAAVQDCLKGFWSFPLPVYSVLCALCACAVLKNKLRLLKTLNALSVAAALVLLMWLYFSVDGNAPCENVPVNKTLQYSLFSLTVTMGILTAISVQDKTKNTLSTTAASIVLVLLMIAVLSVCDFSLSMPLCDRATQPALKLFCAICLILCTVTGVAANILPVFQGIRDVFDDDSLCLAVIFCLAVALSVAGFDRALRYGYLFVSAVGAVTFVAAGFHNVRSFCKNKNQGGSSCNTHKGLH